MFIKEYIEDLLIPENLFSKYKISEIAFFDIETTGFDKDEDSIILISFGEFISRNNYKITQYFAESLTEESSVLIAFCNIISQHKIWCSYNGLAFDEPFVKRRLLKCNLDFHIPEVHIDLYRRIKPYHKQLGMDRCNLKTVEKFLGIERLDQIDGAISVQLYDEYLASKNIKLQNILMLHNYEDVLHLPRIFNILNEIDTNDSLIRDDCLTDKQFIYLNSLIKKNKILFRTDLKKLNRKTAAKVIDSILKGNFEEDLLIKNID